MRDTHVTVQTMRDPFGDLFNPDIAPVILEEHVPRERCSVGMVMWSGPVDDQVAYIAEPYAHSPNATLRRVRLSAPLP
jgi:hypothetical protein